MREAAQTAPFNGKASVIIVVAESGFSPPHGKKRTGVSPAVKDRTDVQVGVRRKARCVFPVVCEVEFRNAASWLLPDESGQASVEDGVFHDLIAGQVILVPASAPVRDDYGWPVASDKIAHSKCGFVIGGNLSVGVAEKFDPCTQAVGSPFR